MFLGFCEFSHEAIEVEGEIEMMDIYEILRLEDPETSF